MSNKSFNNIFKGDKVIWVIFMFLCLISIIEVYSASSSLSYKTGIYWSPILDHVKFLFIGLCTTIIFMNIPCKYFKWLIPISLGLAFILLIVLLSSGDSINGSKRWIEILGIKFQPSEIAKGGLIVFTANALSAMQTEKGIDKKAFKYILIVVIPFILLILPENFSTAALIFATIFIMMYIGLVPIKQLKKLFLCIVLIIGIAVTTIMLLGDDKKTDNTKQNLTEETASLNKEDKNIITKFFHRIDTWKQRIINFTNNEKVDPKDYDLNKNAQIGHANIAVASSKLIGKGPGNSTERDFLSQAFSDFIYAIIIEEMGLWGAAGVALLYIFLLFHTSKIANRCENSFPAFLSMGITLLFVIQAIFNMAVAVGLGPITGQPLPLISKGGTSTIINCMYIGILLSISRFAKQRNNIKQRNKNSFINKD